jgi:hypothetical protein
MVLEKDSKGSPASHARAPSISFAADRHLLIGTIDTTKKTSGRVRCGTSLDFSQKNKRHIPTLTPLVFLFPTQIHNNRNRDITSKVDANCLMSIFPSIFKDIHKRGKNLLLFF